MSFICDKKIIKIEDKDTIFYFDDNNTIWNEKMIRVGFYNNDKIIFYDDVKKKINKILKR